ncbi:MAG: endolytic transglycosylase MltG [Candidatus Dojkabacteria bacterium]|nr:endolytic transglycosylase MltG [Candidatus Dojkabacteria bacterium]
MKKFLLLILIIFTIFIATGILIILSIYNDTVNFVYKSNIEETFEVKEGDTILSLLPLFQEKGYIKNTEIIRIYLKLEKFPEIKVGKYVLPKEFNFKQLIDILSKGGKKNGILITIKEGMIINEIAQVIKQKNPKIDESKFISIAKNTWSESLDNELVNQIKQFMNNQNYSLEGFLFPDTYEILEEWDEKKIIELLLNTFIAKTNDIRQNAQYSQELKNFYEALILASIIEKESSYKDKKADISSVFHNRLKINMKLQSDATVNYITGKKDPGILISDQAIDSPYNTYKYLGLPPSPISNPGLESIKAALYPSSTPYFFFFHDDNGNAYFSKTYAEHNKKLLEIRGKK